MRDTDYLLRLARVLAAAGWTCRPRIASTPPLVIVAASEKATVGESIRVKAGVGGVPWFVTSTGHPLAPCHDLLEACAAVIGWMESLTEAACHAMVSAAVPVEPRGLVARVRDLTRR
ncbi:hypothetical protein [Actinomadura fibrosa]|uniref:Uncharacterized protein n=1 Tax=Actinomadura fibrosa TaxID=111802 RepID=A0ABW2XJB3_9ACTN|nr:hypothetical protein [Actinomadura fibrosa]